MQPTHTGAGLDLAAVAAAAGFPTTAVATDDSSLARVTGLIREAPGPVLAVITVETAKHPLVMPPKDGAYLKDRFREALLGKQAVA
jgi:hypothetical protein